MSYKGLIRFRDLEGGLWLLASEDGLEYQLEIAASERGELREGQRVLVEGKVIDDAMGIGMTAPILRVKSWQAA